jgi:hypothetical protein
MTIRHAAALLAFGFSSAAFVNCSSSNGAGDVAISDAGASDGAASDGSSSSDASAATDGGADASTAPIVAPNDTWTWVDFPDSKCANGSPTGIAINPHAGATDVMFYFEGGGECYDAASCWESNPPKAANLDGYDSTTFATVKQKNYPILNRADATNPFNAMNFVYIPYCTGDLHAGQTIANLALSDGGTRPTYFYGATDMDIFLARVVPTFPGTTHVWETGTSAGGFGTFLNFDRIHTAFNVRVDMLDDSGPAILGKGGVNNKGLLDAWGYVAPTGCASPCDAFSQILAYDTQTQATFSPPGRYGFMTFAEDTTIAPDFGYALADYPGVMATYSSSLPAAPAAATFIVSNEPQPSHVVESDGTLETQYMPWITAMVTDSTTWADTTYAHP